MGWRGREERSAKEGQYIGLTGGSASGAGLAGRFPQGMALRHTTERTPSRSRVIGDTGGWEDKTRRIAIGGMKAVLAG